MGNQTDYGAFALAAILDPDVKTKTVIIETATAEVVYVLKAPRENIALRMFEDMEGISTERQIRLATELVVEMAYIPVLDNDGNPLNFGTEEEPMYRCDKKLLSEEMLEKLLQVPLGTPIALLRDEAVKFVGELAKEGNSSKEVAGGGTSESQSSSEESTNETSDAGAKTE